MEDKRCKGIAGGGGRTGGDVQGAPQGAARGCPLEVQAQRLMREVWLRCCISCQQQAEHHMLHRFLYLPLLCSINWKPTTGLPGGRWANLRGQPCSTTHRQSYE